MENVPQVEHPPKLAQSAPVMPSPKPSEELPSETYGVKAPISAATVPSVYNKKLNKLFRGRLVVLPGDTLVSEALRRMSRYNISSVPVTKTRKDSTILGFVDMLDFLAYLCKLVGKPLPTEGNIELSKDDIESMKDKSEEFKNTPIRELIDLSGRNPFHTMHGEDSLSDAVEQYLQGVHRIAITDDDGDIVGVISQWTIANYLSTVPTDDKIWIPTIREPIGESKYTISDVVTINKNKTTLEGFLLMHSKNLSALAVVDDNNVLCGNLSASDLKGFQLFFKEFSDLSQPISEFLGTIRKKQGRADNFVVAVKNTVPVKDVIDKFNEEIIHRVYVVDNAYKPVGVFSLSDLMKGLIVDTHTSATFAKPINIPNYQPESVSRK